MRSLFVALCFVASACGDDVCRHLDPDVRAFWTQDQRDACPAAPRPPATPWPPPDKGAAPDLATTTPSPASAALLSSRVGVSCDE